MSIYCTTEDVQAEFPALVVGTGDDGAVITEDLLEDWIQTESAVIDGYVGQRYVTPIYQSVSPNSFLILRRICIFRVGQRVTNKIEVKSNVTQKNSEEKFEQNYVRTPNSDLDKIAKGNMLLSDAVLIEKNQGVNSFMADTTDCKEKAFFDVGKQQW